MKSCMAEQIIYVSNNHIHYLLLVSIVLSVYICDKFVCTFVLKMILSRRKKMSLKFSMVLKITVITLFYNLGVLGLYVGISFRPHKVIKVL